MSQICFPGFTVDMLISQLSEFIQAVSGYENLKFFGREELFYFIEKALKEFHSRVSIVMWLIAVYTVRNFLKVGDKIVFLFFRVHRDSNHTLILLKIPSYLWLNPIGSISWKASPVRSVIFLDGSQKTHISSLNKIMEIIRWYSNWVLLRLIIKHLVG